MDGVNERSRAAAADDDGSDQIGFETPRSGVATPQPDLHDKRLPGIMSYFGQVRPASLKRLLSGTFNATGHAATASSPGSPSPEEPSQPVPQSQTPISPLEQVPPSSTPSEEDGPPPLPSHETVGSPAEKSAQDSDQLHPYPTPPTSQRSSLRNYPTDAGGERSRRGTTRSSRPSSLGHVNISDLAKGKARRNSLLAPLVATVDGASVSASHISNPAGRACTAPSSPRCAAAFSSENLDASSPKSASISQLKKLTYGLAVKSGTSTPTRALSSAQPSQTDGPDATSKENGDGVDRTAANTPTPQGAQAPAAKGKLTIKVLEARGLKRCRDPYVVAVFQRSELISGGPHIEDDDEDAAVLGVAMGGVAIQRQGSDSGRPAMAIPMRSRQSSNTSITDHNTFRNRNTRRSFTNPKWDAEAALYV